MATSANSKVARDVLGFALHYYHENTGDQFRDYKTIAGAGAFASPSTATGFVSLYNGNIGDISINNAGLLKGDPGTTYSLPLFNRYRYDQLNRLVSMQVYTGLDAGGNHWNNAQTIDDYKDAISYDGNGNLLTYMRNGAPATGKPTQMDDMGMNIMQGPTS